MTTVYLSGRFCPLEEARVPLTERGLTFGDGVHAVTAIDERAVGDGRPGPIARRLLDGFRRLV